jgi:ferredoxin
MSVQFLKKDKRYDTEECSRDLNLLAHAQMIELSIGSECGGHGRCGADRVILSKESLSKVNPPTAIEKHHLSDAELKQGMRLACQCFPNENGLLIDDCLVLRG